MGFMQNERNEQNINSVKKEKSYKKSIMRNPRVRACFCFKL